MKYSSLSSQRERPDGNFKKEQTLVNSDAGITNSVLLCKLLFDNQRFNGAK